MPAYGLLDHRHTPEIEQATGAQVLFTPHLVPMTRGILSTIYATPAPGASRADLLSCLADTYAGEPFAVVDERIPATKAVRGPNCAHLTVSHHERTGRLLVISAHDNLVKGQSGQPNQRSEARRE